MIHSDDPSPKDCAAKVVMTGLDVEREEPSLPALIISFSELIVGKHSYWDDEDEKFEGQGFWDEGYGSDTIKVSLGKNWLYFHISLNDKIHV